MAPSHAHQRSKSTRSMHLVHATRCRYDCHERHYATMHDCVLFATFGTGSGVRTSSPCPMLVKRVRLTSPSGSRVDMIPEVHSLHARTSTCLLGGRQHQFDARTSTLVAFSLDLGPSPQARRYSCYLDQISIAISLSNTSPPHRRVDHDHRNEQRRLMRHHADFGSLSGV